jgi:hypothetical protein
MSISRKLQRARARAMEKPQVKRAMADARKDFIAKFGREPLEGEPLIFDPDFDTPTPYTDEKTTAMMIEAMEAAGTPGHLIYAYRKTGMIKGRKMPDCGPKRRSTNGMPRWRNMRHCTDQLERKNSRQCCACRRSL